MRSAFAGLNQELGDTAPFRQPYPLLVTEIPLSAGTNARTDFDLRSAASRYFVLESDTGHPAIRLALGTPGGAPVPSSARARVVVMRIR